MLAGIQMVNLDRNLISITIKAIAPTKIQNARSPILNLDRL